VEETELMIFALLVRFGCDNNPAVDTKQKARTALHAGFKQAHLLQPVAET